MDKDIIKAIVIFALLILCFKLASTYGTSTYNFDKAQNSRYLKEIEELKERESR